MDEFNCSTKGGGIKAILISPYVKTSDSEHLASVEPFLQIGDMMTEEGESVMFGNDTIYTKIKSDG